MNITDLISQTARATPEADAIVEQGRAISYRELDRLVARFAARLIDAGVAPGRLVGVSLARIDPMNIALTLALARMGAVSVPLATNRSAAARAAESAQFELAAVIAEDPQYAIEGRKFVAFGPGWADADAAAEARESFDRPGWPWRLHLSSGTTTRRLKGVLESHNSLVSQAIAYKASGLAAPEARFLIGLPMTVASGIRPCLRSLLSGNPVIFPRSHAMADLVEAIERHRATHLRLTQITVQELLRTLPAGRLRFPGVRRLIVGGFATPPALVEEMADRIAPEVSVLYGATEVGVIAFANLEDLRRAPGSVGRPMPGIKVQIVDEQDALCRCGETGIVRVRGIALPAKYFKDPESTQKVFRDGWVYPGDFGRMDDSGCLWLESRLDDVIKVGGRIIDLARIDRILAEHPQVADAAAYTVVTRAGVTEVHAAVVTRGALDEAALRAHCQSGPAALAVLRRLSMVAALPRNEDGKVMRHALARQLGDEAARA